MADQRLIEKEAHNTPDEPLTLANRSFRSNSNSDTLLGRVRSESFKRDIDQNDIQNQIEIQSPAPTSDPPQGYPPLAAHGT